MIIGHDQVHTRQTALFETDATALALNPWPQSSSVTARTLRLETPWIYISASASSRAFSMRWYRVNTSVRNSPPRSCGTLEP